MRAPLNWDVPQWGHLSIRAPLNGNVPQWGHLSTRTPLNGNIPPPLGEDITQWGTSLSGDTTWQSHPLGELGKVQSPPHPFCPPADLYRKVFVFREDPSDAYVLLQAQLERPMLNFTVCLRSYTDLTRPHSLFSYATKAQDNEILLFKPKPGEYRFYVGGKYVTFRVPENRGEWEHVCASWESGSGIAEFWLNGRPWPRKGLQKGYEVGNEAVVMLGQEQDAYGGGFDVYNSFTGEMADVHLWDAGLSPDKMRSAYLALRLPPAPLAWGRLRYEAKGDVVVKPRLREALGA